MPETTGLSRHSSHSLPTLYPCLCGSTGLVRLGCLSFSQRSLATNLHSANMPICFALCSALCPKGSMSACLCLQVGQSIIGIAGCQLQGKLKTCLSCKCFGLTGSENRVLPASSGLSEVCPSTCSLALSPMYLFPVATVTKHHELMAFNSSFMGADALPCC